MTDVLVATAGATVVLEPSTGSNSVAAAVHQEGVVQMTSSDGELPAGTAVGLGPRVGSTPVEEVTGDALKADARGLVAARARTGLSEPKATA